MVSWIKKFSHGIRAIVDQVGSPANRLKKFLLQSSRRSSRESREGSAIRGGRSPSKGHTGADAVPKKAMQGLRRAFQRDIGAACVAASLQ